MENSLDPIVILNIVLILTESDNNFFVRIFELVKRKRAAAHVLEDSF